METGAPALQVPWAVRAVGAVGAWGGPTSGPGHAMHALGGGAFEPREGRCRTVCGGVETSGGSRAPWDWLSVPGERLWREIKSIQCADLSRGGQRAASRPAVGMCKLRPVSKGSGPESERSVFKVTETGWGRVGAGRALGRGDPKRSRSQKTRFLVRCRHLLAVWETAAAASAWCPRAPWGRAESRGTGHPPSSPWPTPWHERSRAWLRRKVSVYKSKEEAFQECGTVQRRG